MAETVFIASALMGAGKTIGLVDWLPMKRPTSDGGIPFKENWDTLESDSVFYETPGNVLLAVPTIKLAEGIVDAMRKRGIEYEVITSAEGQKRSVKSRVEDALTEGREDCVLVITQATLVNLHTSYLKGWKIVCDEIPNLNNCQKSRKISFDTFGRLFRDFIQEHDDGSISAADGVDKYIFEEEYRKARQADIHPSMIMFAGLKENKAEVSYLKHEDGFTIKVIDYHDYAKVIRACDEFHVMGNAVHKSLFYLYLIAQGFDIQVSHLTPTFKGYKLPPVLVPLVDSDKFSKKMMLTREDGFVADEFDESCFGWKLIETALMHHKNEKVLFQGFKWMKKFPFRNYPKVTFTAFDVRGLNDYRDYHRTVNIFHGNPDPIQAQMNDRLLDMMGIPLEAGRKAIEHERFIEPMAQHMLRTDMRNGDNQEYATVTVLPTLEVAERIADVLQMEAEIDTSIMVEPPKKAVTNKKMELSEVSVQLYNLKQGGKSVRAIAEELGISKSKVGRLVKEYEEKLAA